MDEPEDEIVPRLRDMRWNDMTSEERTSALMTELRWRFGSDERARKSLELLWTADVLIGRLVVGDFERRIEALEGRVRELQHCR